MPFYHYSKALAATMLALNDHTTAKSDATLASVLLLGLFENISGELPAGGWQWHIKGAIELVYARGHSQVSTTLGLDLFIAARTQMYWGTSNAQLRLVDSKRSQRSTAARCQQYNMCTAVVKAKVAELMPKPRRPETVEAVHKAIEDCQRLIKNISDWSSSFPQSCRWVTAGWEAPSTVLDYKKASAFPGRIDRCSSIWLASIWNMLRCSHVILESTVVRCAAWLDPHRDYRTTPEYAAATKSCSSTIEDFIASVPYQFGYMPFFGGETSRGPGYAAYKCGHDDAPKTLPGFILMWPLTCMMRQDYTTDAQRQWLRGRLEYLGCELGIRCALKLAK
ncbi:hypothetical protein QQS21_012210, partial [Conoideocrella luteorostrata]